MQQCVHNLHNKAQKTQRKAGSGGQLRHQTAIDPLTQTYLQEHTQGLALFQQITALVYDGTNAACILIIFLRSSQQRTHTSTRSSRCISCALI